MLSDSTRMDLEIVMLSKVSQTKANIIWYQLYVGFFLKGVNELICKPEAEPWI